MIIDDKTLCGVPLSSLPHTSQLRVKVQCDTCGSVSETSVASWHAAQKRRSFTGETSCKGCANRRSGAARVGKPAWNKGKLSERAPYAHPMWKGGSYVDVHGYRMVYVGKGRREDGVGWRSYRKEHILVVEHELGRPLSEEETVHHIDGDRLHNDIRNLWVTDNAGHRTAHQSLQEIGYLLIKSGLIQFNTETGQYMAHVKLRELLGHPEEGNQQPSLIGDEEEGSETTGESP